MTKAEKIAAYEMFLDGFSYAEIGRKFCVSREYIFNLFNNNRKSKAGTMKCIYVGLSSWLVKNEKSAFDLKECFKGKSNSSIYWKLAGKSQITVTEAKAILAYTGLTFDEAFGQEEQPE